MPQQVRTISKLRLLEPLGVLGCPALYARLHDRLLRGYVMDVLGTQQSANISQQRAQEFLDQVCDRRSAPRRPPSGSASTGC